MHWFKKLLIAFGIMTVLFLALLFWPKARIVPNNDLRLQRSTISSNENGFYLIANSSYALELTEDERSNIGEAQESDDTNVLQRIIVQHFIACETLQKVLAAKGFEIDEPLMGIDDYLYLKTWRSLAVLNNAKARLEFLSGNESNAFTTAQQSLRFGSLIKSGKGALLHYLTGSSIKAIGEETIRKISIGSSNILLLKATLENIQHPPDYMAITNTLKCEYETALLNLDQIAEGNLPGMITSTLGYLGWKASSKMFINPKKSEHLATKATFHLFESVTKTWSQMNTNLPLEPNDTLNKAILSRNLVGNDFLEMTFPSWLGVLRRKCREIVSERCTITIVAIRCYELKYGSLPDSLEQLVPEFLTAVPLDDFDGKPLRYSKEQKLVYSVGEDLVDSGGIERDSNRKRLDIVYSFDPAKLVFKQKKEGMNSPPEQIELVE